MLRGLTVGLVLLCVYTCTAKPPPPPGPNKSGSFDLIVQANLELTPNVNRSRPPLPDHVFEADIALTDDQRRNIDIFGNAGRGASSDKNIRWPNGVIPYEIDCSLQRMPNAVDAIKKAMQEWQTKTCIRFVPRKGQKDYVWFFRNKGCWSNLGRIGNKNTVSVGDGCEYQHVMIHEIGHAIGFWHEQSRPDRDTYVRVNKDNILPGFESAFEKYGRGKIDSMNIAYDYESIMHYPFNAFSKNGKPTMTALKPLNGKAPYGKLSALDAKQANLMYNNCGKSSPAPEPFKRKRREAARNIRQKRAVCRNYHNYCSYYARQGYCRTNANYMARTCRKSCGWCRTVTNQCRDLNGYCSSWARRGECGRNPAYMNQNCKRSCRKCGVIRPSTQRPRPPTQRPKPPTQRPKPPTQRPKPPTQRPKPPTQRPRPPTQPPTSTCGIRHYGRFPGRVVDGQTAAKNSWPWQVQILKQFGGHQCGGSLLTSQWILTAAHCFYGSSVNRGYGIKLGEHQLNRRDGTEQEFSVSQIIIHPGYDRKTLNNDVALVKLNRHAHLNKAVSTVCLPNQGVNVKTGTNCYITGWGRTGYNKPGSNVLQEAMMPTADQKQCLNAMGKVGTVTNKMLCAGYGGSSTVSGCMGDSGGPFVCKASNNRWVIQGVVSWGTRTCSAGINQYTVFARVSEFTAWIRQHIGAGGPQTPPPPKTPPPRTLPPTPPRPNTPPPDTLHPTPPRPDTPPPNTLPPTPPRPQTPKPLPPTPKPLPPTPPTIGPPPKPCLFPVPLGLEDRSIPDSAMSASTQVNRWHSAREGRLNLKHGVTGVGAWCSRDMRKDEYLEIDLGAKTILTGIATQGRESKYPRFVKSYELHYSDDGTTWIRYSQVFTGNVDMSTTKRNAIHPAIATRYIRIVPKTWQLHICMRAELYGCPVKPTTTSPTTTKAPVTTTTPPTTTASPPVTATKAPATTTNSPATTTNSQKTTTALPDNTTARPLPPTPPRPTTLPTPPPPPTTSPGFKTIPPNPIGIRCKDKHPSCPTWVSQGRCVKDDYVKRNCLKSCKSKQCDNEPVRPFAPCSGSLGLGWDNKLPDAAFTASSELNLGSWDAGARNARLYFEDDHTDKRVGAWCAGSNKDQWLQVDLGRKTYVTAVTTQGRHRYYEHVKTYKLSHSIDGTNWDFVKDDSGADKVFKGNCDHFTPVVNVLSKAVSARYIKFHPVTAKTVCMRVEIYGCV